MMFFVKDLLSLQKEIGKRQRAFGKTSMGDDFRPHVLTLIFFLSLCLRILKTDFYHGN